MNIICTQSVLEADNIFSHLGTVTIIEDKLLTRQHLQNADVLITRSQTVIDEALLKDTPVKFVGTATSGTDHVDLIYLQKQSIQFADAKGSNANAVAEHVLMCLPQKNMTIGIIGYGCVGKRLHHLLQQSQCKVLINDLPLYDQGHLPEHVSLDDICEQADVISLHIPLNLQERYNTYQLVNADFFAKCQQQPLLINTARGDVVDYQAMLSALANKQIKDVILDVWPNEPNIDKRYIKAAKIATPHIAGHSVEAKWQGTYQVYLALCDYLQVEPIKQTMTTTGQQSYSLIEVDNAMKQLAESTDDIAIGFNQLRKRYGNRHEQHRTSI